MIEYAIEFGIIIALWILIPLLVKINKNFRNSKYIESLLIIFKTKFEVILTF